MRSIINVHKRNKDIVIEEGLIGMNHITLDLEMYLIQLEKDNPILQILLGAVLGWVTAWYFL